MNYNLEALAKLCAERSLTFHRPTEHALEVTIAPDCILAFENLIAEKDTIAGFKETAWHFHGTLLLMTDEATSIEYSELGVVEGLLSGDIIVLSRYLTGKLAMRWLAHKEEKIDIKYIAPGEELRAQRLF